VEAIARLHRDRVGVEDLERALAADLGAVPAEHRFRVRVAANVCAILARETAALAPDRAEQRALAAEIRAGTWDERLPELAARLREEVRARLAIAHPGWDAVADDGR
ncbi:MAG TPA: DUF6285 domain-containing protein, partial [Solirubrobacterales bacterium]|nr:DUF6285 domain-containing protein [Solirubrobacterales bacterium]